jgi:hypothetical protein
MHKLRQFVDGVAAAESGEGVTDSAIVTIFKVD